MSVQSCRSRKAGCAFVGCGFRSGKLKRVNVFRFDTEADIDRRDGYVRFVPLAAVSRVQQKTSYAERLQPVTMAARAPRMGSPPHRQSGLLDFDIGRPNDLAPLLIFQLDEAGEFFGGTDHWLTKILREHLFAKAGRRNNTPGFGIDLADDVDRCSFRRIETEPCVCFQSR